MASVPVAEREAEVAKKSSTMSRKTVYDDGAIVEYTIPKYAQPCVFESEALTLRYLKFAHRLDGGWVGVHVHSSDENIRGATIRARVMVVRRSVVGGKRFLYVDLVPVSAETPVTHWLSIRSEGGKKPRAGSVVLKTEGGVRGLIALIPCTPPPGSNRKPAHSRKALLAQAGKVSACSCPKTAIPAMQVGQTKSGSTAACGESIRDQLKMLFAKD